MMNPRGLWLQSPWPVESPTGLSRFASAGVWAGAGGGVVGAVAEWGGFSSELCPARLGNEGVGSICMFQAGSEHRRSAGLLVGGGTR